MPAAGWSVHPGAGTPQRRDSGRSPSEAVAEPGNLGNLPAAARAGIGAAGAAAEGSVTYGVLHAGGSRATIYLLRSQGPMASAPGLKNMGRFSKNMASTWT